MRAAVLVTASVAVLLANPVMPVVFSEIQTAPDSLERIEFHVYAGGDAFDLSGAQIVTRAGTAVVDSGLVIYPDSGFVVVDSTNTAGVFSLGDDSDYVRLVMHGDTSFRLWYPANPFRSFERSWAPPPMTSSSIFQWWEWQNGEWFDYYTWYIDSTPTPGAPNDDTLGGITGYVYGDSGLPVDGATIRMAAVHGFSQMTSRGVWLWPHGYFAQTPTGPGRFVVTAECDGYLPYTYPETIELAPNEGRGISIYLDRAGVAEAPSTSSVAFMRVAGRALLVSGDGTAPVSVQIYNQVGSRVNEYYLGPVRGEKRIELPKTLAPGIYFAIARRGACRNSVKVVLW